MIPGGTQRVVFFSRYLTDRKHKVGLIGSARRKINNNDLIWWNEELNKVKTYPLVMGKLLRCLNIIKEKLRNKKSIKIYLNEYQNKKNNIQHRNEIKKNIFKNRINCIPLINIAKKIYNFFFIFGDDGIFELPSLKIHLSRVLIKFKPDVVIVSVPPHSWLRVVPWLKLKYPLLPLIIDFRDGWTSTGIFRAKSLIRRSWQDYLEKRVILSANGLVFVSPGLKEFYCNKYKNVLPYSEIIFNGYSERLWNNIDVKKINAEFQIKKHRPCIIKYVGSIGFDVKCFRSPYNIFLALESCFEKGLISSNDFILSFTGFISDIEILNNFPLLKKNIQINNPVSPLDAFKEMKTSDILLIVHKQEKGAEEHLTGKLFDYLRAEKPIFAITPSNCGIKIFLEKLDIGIWADISNLEDISKKFINILKIFKSNRWSEWSKKNVLKPSEIKKYSREYQYEKFEKIIIKIVNEKDHKGVNQ